MKKVVLTGAGVLTGAVLAASAADFSIFASTWDAKDGDRGNGGGIKITKSIAHLLFADVRGSYLRFDDAGTDLIPIEASLNVRLPIIIEPYAGAGAGYYLADSSSYDSSFGWFGQLGLGVQILMVGVYGEIRHMDLDGTYMDGTAANVGVTLRW